MSEDLGSVLHARGLRLTPQRERVLRAVRDLGHATPEEVAAHLDAQGELAGESAGVNPSTVHRALSLLEELGLVGRTRLDRRSPSFHAVEHGDHLHLLCDGCGTVAEVPAALAAAFADDVVTRTGFLPDTHHLALHGHCGTCRASSGAVRGAGAHHHPSEAS